MFTCFIDVLILIKLKFFVLILKKQVFLPAVFSRFPHVDIGGFVIFSADTSPSRSCDTMSRVEKMILIALNAVLRERNRETRK